MKRKALWLTIGLAIFLALLILPTSRAERSEAFNLQPPAVVETGTTIAEENSLVSENFPPPAACMINCPANITVSNDPNQCGAVVNYPAPTTTADCGMVTCSPASGSFFPVGTTTVTCTTSAGPSCAFDVTVVDTQPPTITCPANLTATVATECPTSSGTGVTFPAPTASDNCPGVVTVCNPPSGSTFPIGTTTITCTATDSSGNTATCSFTSTVFSGCLQDESNPNNVVFFNAASGQYRFIVGGTIFTGAGTLTVRGCTVTIQHNPTDRRVLIKYDGGTFQGSASIQFPPGTMRGTITDRNTRNNNCTGGP